MPTKRPLDPRAAAAIDHLRAYAADWNGTIRPRHLTAALPPRSCKRGWCDFVAHAVLEEIIGIHRADRNGNVFFTGDLYQVKGRDLARQLCTSPNEISSALSWLEAQGLIVRVTRTLLDDDGQPRGKKVFAYPVMDALQALVEAYKATGKTPKPFYVPPRRGGLTPEKSQVDSRKEAVSLAQRGGYSLNCPERQQKSAESDSVTFAEASASMLHCGLPDHVGRKSHAVNGGGSAADRNKQIPSSPSACPSAPQAHGTQAAHSTPHPSKAQHSATLTHEPLDGNGHMSASPSAHWTPPLPPNSLTLANDDEKKAWKKAARFFAIWPQAQMRLGYVNCCKPTSADHEAAFHFFIGNPQTNPFYAVSVAINAWSASQEKKPERYDTLFHCRKSLILRSFLQSFAAGKLEPEIGGYGLKINTWKDLRLCFTQSELMFYGWLEVPILKIHTDELWEHDPDAPEYYRCRKLPLPPEVAAVEKLRQQDDGSPKS